MDQIALLNRIYLLMGHTPLMKFDACFVFGRAKNDWEPTEGDTGILETASHFYFRRILASICIPGTPGGATHSGETVNTTYPGPHVWRKYLQTLSVPRENIIETKPAPVHTRGDSDSFVEECKKRGWRTAAIIMNAHQVLRSMLAILKSFELHAHHMDVVPMCPQRVNWEKPVYGSQGAELLPRKEHIDLEWNRIIEQQEKGYLASFEKLLKYLEQ